MAEWPKASYNAFPCPHVSKLTFALPDRIGGVAIISPENKSEAMMKIRVFILKIFIYLENLTLHSLSPNLRIMTQCLQYF